MAHLVVDDLSRRFGPRWVLARLSFEVQSGDALLLLGANGSGKTTLLRCLATALKPHHGRILLNGEDLWSDRSKLRHRVALLSHASRLYDDLSAAQNLRAWAAMGDVDASTVPALLERVGLAETGDRPSRAFSAGMKRRLALALMLMKRPVLALFDEPFTSLDVDGRALTSAVIDELRSQGTTIVLSTHHPEIGARHCPRAIRLEGGKDGGRIAWTGPAADAVATRDE